MPIQGQIIAGAGVPVSFWCVWELIRLPHANKTDCIVSNASNNVIKSTRNKGEGRGRKRKKRGKIK